MNIETVKRVSRKVADTPQRGPRTRDRRASHKRLTREMLDAYRTGYTDELED